MTPKDQDVFFMRRAIEIAQKGGIQTRPNPNVGCVLVKNGKIIAEAWHKKFGGPHAEASALKQAGPRAKGSVAYVTLEPCVGFPGKKTPSCATALAQVGIKRVVIAHEDPNSKVSGQGIRLLRRNKMTVSIGILKAESEKLNTGFIWRHKYGRPYVILKLALSLDGKAFALNGKSKWITEEPARRLAHIIRSRVDAILVGIETVIKDNPSLSSHGKGLNPLRVILDTHLRAPKTAKVFDSAAKTLIFTATKKIMPNVETIKIPLKNKSVSLSVTLRELAQRGVGTLLVEGGPKICAAFLNENLADEINFFISPKLLSGAFDPNRAPQATHLSLKKIGHDYFFQGKIRSPQGFRTLC